MSLNKKMGDAHEEHLAQRLGGRKSKSSGNQFSDQMDGRHSRLDEHFAFAWDGKSTLGKSVGVSREMWRKAGEQSHGERPMLGLRFYDDERLRGFTDLVVIDLEDFVELLESARKLAEMTQGDWIGLGVEKGWCSEPVCSTHDGMPVIGEEEEAEWEAGHDPCVPAVRLLDS